MRVLRVNGVAPPFVRDVVWKSLDIALDDRRAGGLELHVGVAERLRTFLGPQTFGSERHTPVCLCNRGRIQHR